MGCLGPYGIYGAIFMVLTSASVQAQTAGEGAGSSVIVPVDVGPDKDKEPAEHPDNYKSPVNRILGVDRRRDQYGKDFGYFVYPIAGDIPGLGQAAGLGATLMNMGGSDMDFTGFKVDGDFSASGATLLDINLIPQRLIFDFGYYDYDVAPVDYARGLDSDKDDYLLPKVKGYYWLGQMTLTFMQRKVEAFYRLGLGKSQLLEIREKDGSLYPIGDTSEKNARGDTLGVSFDNTDDRLDPRTGVRAEIARKGFNNEDPLVSDFYIMDYNLTAYVPMRRWDTLAFNLFRSDAHVTRQASTDEAYLKSQFGFNCAPADQACLQVEQEFVDRRIQFNQYGVASSLGGTQRLRSFANGRYTAGHSLFYGLEYRWNLTDERVPFDIFIARGVRTGFQLAFFAEQGSVAENTSDLWRQRRTSYGVGFRLVLSGIIIRADYATGDEGDEFVLFINYPWSLFSVDSSG